MAPQKKSTQAQFSLSIRSTSSSGGAEGSNKRASAENSVPTRSM